MTVQFFLLFYLISSAFGELDSWEKRPSNGEGKIEAQIDFSKIAQQKCDSFPARSYFHKEMMTCYILSPRNIPCKREIFPFDSPTNIHSLDKSRFRSIRIEESDLNQICIYRIPETVCREGNQIEDFCMIVVEKELTFSEAAANCESKQSNLFVLHKDRHIQYILNVLINSQSALYWIGTGSKSGIWMNNDGSPIDFFRWNPNKNFTASSLGALIQTRQEQNSWIGYCIPMDASKKYPSICASLIDISYRRIPEPNSFKTITIKIPQTTTSRKSTTMTTRRPTTIQQMRDPRPIIKNAGTIIHRWWWPTLHYYTLKVTQGPAPGWQDETNYATFSNFGNVVAPLYVVSAATRQNLQKECPELVAAKIAHRPVKGMKIFVNSYVGSNAPPDWNDERIPTEYFYCAPRQFYCGANFQLRSVWHRLDLFWPTTDLGANLVLFGSVAPGNGLNDYVANDYSYKNCWVWSYLPQTYKSQVRASGAMIWRYRNDGTKTHYFSLTPYFNANYIRELGVHIVDETGWRNGFQRLCPELIKMGVYQGKNEKGIPITYLGRKPPSGFTLQSNFYCSPRQGYCDADNSLTRIDKPNNWPNANFGTDIFYPSTAAQKALILGGGTPGWKDVIEETGCWTWSMYWTL